jgi:hypothetical protein
MPVIEGLPPWDFDIEPGVNVALVDAAAVRWCTRPGNDCETTLPPTDGSDYYVASTGVIPSPSDGHSWMLGEDGVTYAYTYSATPGAANKMLAIDLGNVRIVISEVATEGIASEPCQGAGWVELRNIGSASVDMSYLSLRGDSGESTLSGEMRAGEYTVLCAESDTLPFQLSKSETLVLEVPSMCSPVSGENAECGLITSGKDDCEGAYAGDVGASDEACVWSDSIEIASTQLADKGGVGKNWALGLYVHNDVVVAFGTPEKQILVEPVFAVCSSRFR